MRWPNSRRRFVILTLLGLPLVSWLTWEVWPRPITVGRSTTYLTGPLRPDGKVDYAAALDTEYAQGVTSENNAAVKLVEAFGPTILAGFESEKVCRRLGMSRPPEVGKYLQGTGARAGTTIESNNRFSGMLEAARESAWESADYPEIADWLADSEDPLQRCREASLCSRMYCPIFSAEPSAGYYTIELISSLRNVVYLLTARAMLRLGSEDTPGALDDVDTMYRLSRLSGEYPEVTDRMRALSFEGEAIRAEAQIALSGLLTREQIALRRHQADSRPIVRSLRESVDHIFRIARVEELQAGIAGDDAPRSARHAPAILLTRVNQTLDECVRVFSKTTRREQIQTLELMKSRLEARESFFRLPQQLPVPSASLAMLSAEEASLASVKMCQVFLEFDDKCLARRRLLQLILASADCKAFTGRFPDTLEHLQQHLGIDLPTDPFSESAFHYLVRHDEQKLQIYSVGPNGRDDRGRWSSPADDIAWGDVPQD